MFDIFNMLKKEQHTALSGLPGFPRRDHRGSLRSARRELR